MPAETNGVNNVLSCCKEAVQFSASFVTLLFAHLWVNLWTCNEFCIFFRLLTLIKIANANAPLNWSAALILFVTTKMH